MTIPIGTDLTSPSKEKAAVMLAALIHREFGVILQPESLLEFVNGQWFKLNQLVHAIHQEYERHEGRTI